MRVLLGLGEIAGYYAGLRKGFEDLGVPVTLLDLSGHPYAYGGWHDSRLTRLARRLSVAERQTASAPRRRLITASRVLVQALLLAWALPRHDLFVFGHGRSFVAQRDLRLLKLCGKKVICVYHGSDARPPYLDGHWGTDVTPEEAARRIPLAAQMKQRVARAERHADGIVNIPTQGHFHERPFVLGVYMGHPARTADQPPAPARRGVREVVALHAPSNPSAKGSDEIRAIFARLRERGLPVTLREIQGVPNDVLRDAIRDCDLVVDQMYADYGMPGLATESAWLGKPVVIGGYAADLWRELLPPDRLPPTEYHRPEDVEAAIAALVEDEERRLALGARGRAFVEEHWRPAQVAGRYLRLARGEIEPRWLYEPGRNRDVHGCFLPEEKVRALVRETLQAGGVEALQLADKPELERALAAFAGGATS